jgi:hypothetical protein
MQKSILMLLLLGFTLSTACGQKTYDSEWNEVESLVRKGLPQSALKIVDGIYLDAKAANNAPQFLKAALYQIRLQSDYQEDFMENSIAKIGGEIETSNSPVKQILYSIRAELYWRYYQGNRYKFMERTGVSNPDLSDMKTWDLQTLVDQVKKDYLSSLEDQSQLQSIRLEDFDPILDTAANSKVFRPTLYDFLAHRALDYFANEEPSVTKPAEGFIADKAEYFAPASEFVVFNPREAGRGELKWHAMKLYRDLVGFHLEDADPAALIDADLQRLKFALQISVMPDKNDLFLNALENLHDRYPSHKHIAGVAYEMAVEHGRRGAAYNPPQSDTNRWELKTAKDICETTIAAFPGSDGAKNCAVYLHQLLEKSISFKAAYANIPDKPFLASLTYKNVKTIYFRVVKFNAEDDRKLRQKERGEKIVARYRSLLTIEEWTLELPDEGDLQSHTARIKMPALPIGYYVILASDNPDFSVDEQSVAYASCWSTNISYINTSDKSDGGMEVFVLDRDKGTALKGVTAKVFVREYNYQSRAYENKEVGIYTSDADGYFNILDQAFISKSFYLEFSHEDDLFFTDNFFYLTKPQQKEKSRIITYFFTDRSIYRPGQTVYFKGIILEKSGDNYEIKPDYASVVVFYDANHQKIAEMAMTTNEFGSFNGAFTAPSGGLTGSMSIRNESGSTEFSVEEYKRPRFIVEIDPLEGSYRLNEIVNVTGKAMNYSGSAVDQAKVSYRVVRTAFFPYWRSWVNWFPYSTETEITSGVTETGPDGAFSLFFKAIPDLSLDKEFQPVFHYKVYVDVTDPAGEVRSAEESIPVGYQALLMEMEIPGKLDVSAIKPFILSTTNLNRQKVPAQGKISIYSLEAPDRMIRENIWPRPDVFVMSREEFLKDFPHDLYDNENDPETWARKGLVQEWDFNTASDTVFVMNRPAEGEYVLVMEAKDAFGEKVEVKKYFSAYQASGKQLSAKSPFWFVMLDDSGEPGDTATFLIGSAEKNARILYEIVNEKKVISRNWLQFSQEKTRLDIPILEEYRGDFFVHLVMVKGNKGYAINNRISVPFTNNQLKITTETFRDKLVPGQEEQWKLRISGVKGERFAAELLASMYDASLDAFREHQWYFDLNRYRIGGGGWNALNAIAETNSHFVTEKKWNEASTVVQGYDRLNWFGFDYYGAPYARVTGMRGMMKNAMPGMDGGALEVADEMSLDEEAAPVAGESAPEEEKEKPAEMPLRKNFNETAFFFPALQTDENGEVLLSFTMPEALTAWKFMALAYTKDLKTGQIEKEIVTRKELMVMTNAPRFFREGDRLQFATRLVSLSEQNLTGEITAVFFDAYTMQPLDELLGNNVKQKSFSVEKGKSEVFTWEINIPEGFSAIVCRVKAVAGEFMDGEEIVVPVLPNRMLVTESLPLPVNGKGSKNFTFKKLSTSATSNSIKNYRLTLEFTSNPAWYAVQALPYLTEAPRESADAIFSRYYANSMASYIANSNPKIRQVFESWKNLTPDALLSNLEKNQELKAVLLSETPWVLEAKDETERKKRIALLFDLNRMADEELSSMDKLRRSQLPNGGWAWFEGMPDNRYITQLIVTGFGKLQNLQVIDLGREPQVRTMVQRAFQYTEMMIRDDYDKLLEHSSDKMDENHLGAVQVQFLYAYSYLKDYVQVSAAGSEAYEYYRGQAAKYWIDQNKYIQGMIAVALHRLDVPDVPQEIMKSLRENALFSDEMGMYWRAAEGYHWHEAPVERQAMLIEAFTEVSDDQDAVEKMKIWLLKQKQTQDWKTTRATADAVYALLLRGTDLLASDKLVEVTLGDQKVEPLKMDGVEVQAGTGYFKVSYSGKEITPEMGNVTVVKQDEGIAWGALYWQYYEDLDKITAAKSPLSIEKELYIERNTPTGPVLEQLVAGKSLKTGDKVKVRVIIRSDRDMEYVHMKDMRAAAFEPVAAISGYRYQDGLGYYESIRDASINFYFDYLRKGTYVFEYPLNVTQKGEFSNGITSIQCLYAPEFAAHSQGIRVTVE